MRPEFPEAARDRGLDGVYISLIAVAVGPSGKLVDAWVWATSGYRVLDDAALRAARQSTYTGAISYCRPVAATYLFRTDFSP
ncbi:MAG: TonB family protein [Candidatus Eremiobacteraeota bacterium]|nr:TonB family protein [Candidatus Eremiobacteraeota bacterium]